MENKNLQKIKTTQELLSEVNHNIRWKNGETIPVKIGDWLAYNGFFYQVSDIKEILRSDDSTFIRIFLIDEDGDPSDTTQLEYYTYIGDESLMLEMKQDSEDILRGELSIPVLAKRLDKSEGEGGTDLMIMNSGVLKGKIELLNSTSKHLDLVKNRAEALLKSKLDGLYSIVRGYKHMVEKINKLIFTIELYEGINEEIHHIKVGANASEESILSIRQKKLFMDEEVGDPTNGGLDFDNIEDFDNWLLEKNTYWNCYNYEFIAPEEKCVVALGIRRRDKNYTDNPFVNRMMNMDNKYTYLLIRNGENIYRIFSELKIGEKMFPNSGELNELQEKWDKAWSDSDKERIDGEVDRFKFNMILLQGIIERTECFPAERYTLTLFRITDDSKVNFIYDADNSKLLPDGIKPFGQWVKEKNEGTGEGSQVLWFAGDSLDYSGKSTDRFFLEYRRWDDNYPLHPNTGIYVLEFYKENNISRSRHFFKYLPERKYDWYDSEPIKKRVSYHFSFSDTFINYDNITREDIKTLEYYVHTRIGRQGYLRKIPILLEIMDKKKAEFIEEDVFIKLALSQAGLNSDSDFVKGTDAMHWWKTKNKWKRTLKSDDTKALRMIVKYLNKEK